MSWGLEPSLGLWLHLQNSHAGPGNDLRLSVLPSLQLPYPCVVEVCVSPQRSRVCPRARRRSTLSGLAGSLCLFQDDNSENSPYCSPFPLLARRTRRADVTTRDYRSQARRGSIGRNNKVSRMTTSLTAFVSSRLAGCICASQARGRIK
ncbi:hypothetical protein N658DRAFT_91756 [Parathielavia hyrcaniae]|uniref:Uncharacterized protein n=1 Tax=Parathielavia hyrcaniae TaxID=113614 RepID=A0AAN6Q2P8_9PEZI|nr:hypothetical protein N658DRAFT_91756 [Parathielavia hyrcaniae]